MSSTDRFVDEVTEELRRDTLFATMRRYAWVAALIVLAIVGGAAFNEWRKAAASASAEAYGSTLQNIVGGEDPEARAGQLATLGLEYPEAIGPTTHYQAAAELESGAADRAQSLLAALPVSQDGLGWNQAAEFKALIIGATQASPEAAKEIYRAYVETGSLYAPLAEEYLAYLEISTGERDAGVARLQRLTEESLTSAQRSRLSEALLALGARDGAP